MQQQGRPEQFLVINSSSLAVYLKKHTARGESVYMTIEAFRSLPHSLGNLENDLNIVYPAYTRFDAQDDTGRQTSHASSSSDAPQNTTPPKGLYVWMHENELTLFNLLCKSTKLNQYLRQSSSMCTPAQFDALLSANSCHKGEKVTKCVRRLLSHVHPDKLDANLRECGEDLYKKISEAYAELKARPNFDTNAPCN